MTIFEAAELGNLQKLKKLISDGAWVNARDNYGRTALMLSADNGHTACVAALIKSGADINAKSYDDRTALVFALDCGCTDCVSLLKNAGADINENKNDVRTTQRDGNMDFAKLLKKACGKMSFFFKKCTKCGKLKPYWAFYRKHSECKECAKKAAKRYYWAKKSGGLNAL